MMQWQKQVVMMGATLMVVACATNTGPGDKQADTPPRLVQKEKGIAWDNPQAFGPVPPEFAENGARVCGALDLPDMKLKATGYHARAMDLNGNPLPGGGYFCEAK